DAAPQEVLLERRRHDDDQVRVLQVGLLQAGEDRAEAERPAPVVLDPDLRSVELQDQRRARFPGQYDPGVVEGIEALVEEIRRPPREDDPRLALEPEGVRQSLRLAIEVAEAARGARRGAPRSHLTRAVVRARASPARRTPAPQAGRSLATNRDADRINLRPERSRR